MAELELLIEAVEYSVDEEVPWWTFFDSKQEAKAILKTISTLELDEYEVIQLADVLEEDYPIDIQSIDTVCKQCLSILKKRLKQ